MALTDLLTQIADSIRSKDGTTDPIVATDFPQRILDITSGGGINGFDVSQGSFVLSTDHALYVDGVENNFIFEHGLSVIPDAVIIFSFDGDYPKRELSTISIAYMLPLYDRKNYDVPIAHHSCIWRINGSANASSTLATGYDTEDIVSADYKNVIVGKNVLTTKDFIFPAGKQYVWLALAWKGESA